jgi:hypothetical protein
MVNISKYLLAGLAIRDRVARRAPAQATPDATAAIDRLAGHRVF